MKLTDALAMHRWSSASCRVYVFLLLGSCVAGCGSGKKTWDWREHFAVDCSVIADRGAVYVHAKDDLPEGTVVEVAELPGLNYTVNPSGVYMTDTSLVPLPAGSQKLTFNASSGEETATASCTIERPVFEAKAKPVQGETEPFKRGRLTYVVYATGQQPPPESEPGVAVEVPLLPDDTVGVSFQAWQPEVHVGDAKLEASDTGVFRVPVATTAGAEIQFQLRNPDSQSADYTLRVVSIRPWVDADINALYTVAEGGYAWAAEAPASRAKGEPINAILINPTGEVLSHLGPMRGLSELERVAHVEITEVPVETCKYKAPDGVEAEITRLAEHAEVVLRVAKTGAELARASLEGKPPGCPDSAEFSVTYTEKSAEGQAWDQALIGEVGPKLLTWFETNSQR